MISDATFEPAPRRKLRLRFILLALLVFVTIACLLLAWWVQPNRVVATALFRVDSATPTLLADEADRGNGREFEMLKKTQVALLKSHFVLNSAVRKPGVASLSILQRRDPVKWLSDHLVVEFPQHGEILAIQLHGVQENAGDLVQLVDAVAKAYQDEVVFRERQQKLSARDLLARTLQDLNSEISRKTEQLFEINREAGRALSDNDTTQVIFMKRLERVESELLRLENEQLQLETSGEPGNAAFYEQRIAQLRDRQKELEQQITNRVENSVELRNRKNEIDRLQRIADETSVKLERMEIEFNAPLRIQQIQPAVASPAD